MDRLIAWLPRNIPAEDPTTIVHGDYRLGNLIVHPVEPRIVAVLDWELSTLGHPLCDLAYNCIGYYLPDPPHVFATVDSAALGLDTDPRGSRPWPPIARRMGRDGIENWRLLRSPSRRSETSPPAEVAQGMTTDFRRWQFVQSRLGQDEPRAATRCRDWSLVA